MSRLKEFAFESTTTGIRASRRGVNLMNSKKKFIDDMDEAFPSGIFTTPNGKVPNLRFRDMHEWCQENGKNPETLTKEELEQFRVK
ncbi:hypothetical protein ACW2QC_06780 [Virgibacillus sp. FSP13]